MDLYRLTVYLKVGPSFEFVAGEGELRDVLLDYHENHGESERILIRGTLDDAKRTPISQSFERDMIFSMLLMPLP